MKRGLPGAALILLLALSASGCSGGGAAVARRSGHAPTAAHPTHTAAASHSRPALTRCSSSVAREPALGGVETAMVALGGQPAGVAITPDGRWSFTALQGPPGEIVVSSDRSFVPRVMRTIRLPAGDDAKGVAVTPDGRLLLVAAGPGVIVISVMRAIDRAAQPVLGALMAPAQGPSARGDAAQVAVSPNGRFAFVSLEGAGALAVFDLQTAAAERWNSAAGFVGTIPQGISPLGVAVSPDGRWLYATSELARAGARDVHPPDGMLTVMNLRLAESRPSASIVAIAPVPCHPVRVAASPDGRLVWVTARTGDALLGFSVPELLSHPGHATVAVVPVGEQPLGLAVLDGGRRLIVADSNLYGIRRASARLTVVNTAAALSGEPALLGAIRAGQEPKQITIEPNGDTALVDNFTSRKLEAVALAKLP